MGKPRKTNREKALQKAFKSGLHPSVDADHTLQYIGSKDALTSISVALNYDDYSGAPCYSARNAALSSMVRHALLLEMRLCLPWSPYATLFCANAPLFYVVRHAILPEM